MSINIPDKFQTLNVRELTTGQNVQLDDWKNLVENQHYMWSRQIAHLGGYYFEPVWTTNSTSYKTVPSNKAADLEDLTCGGRLTKKTDAGEVVLFFGAVVAGLTVDVEVYTISEGSIPDRSQIAQTNLTESSGARFWITALKVFDPSNLEDIVTLELQARGEAEPLEFYQFQAWEYVIDSSSDIPTQLDV